MGKPFELLLSICSESPGVHKTPEEDWPLEGMISHSGISGHSTMQRSSSVPQEAILCPCVITRAAPSTATSIKKILNAPYWLVNRHWPELPECPPTSPDTLAPGSPRGH